MFQEKIRKIGNVNYANNFIPDDYRCNHCGAYHVKLWRDYNKSIIRLLCLSCAISDQGVEALDYTGDINLLVPAIPIEGENNWGYKAASKKGIVWWKSLPSKLANYKTVSLDDLEKATTNIISFGVTVKPITRAILVARELGFKRMPESWIVYMESGWRINNFNGQWRWAKPLLSGNLTIDGLVSDTILDISKLLDSKKDLSTKTSEKLKDLCVCKNDVGKVFYLKSNIDFGQRRGAIIKLEDFLMLDPSEVLSWIEIKELDVNLDVNME